MSKKRVTIIAIICTILTLLLFVLSQKQLLCDIKETSSRSSNNETINKDESMEVYLNKLLFDSNKDLISYFKDANDYIPLYNIDSFRVLIPLKYLTLISYDISY